MKNLRYNNICLRALTILCLMMASVGAWAQTYYVFYNSTYGYLVNNNGNLRTSTTFTGPSSVWIAPGSMASTNRTVQSYSQTSRYLNGSAGNAVTLTTTSSNFQVRNNVLVIRSTNNYQVTTNNGTSFTATRNATTTFTAYTVTINNVAVNNNGITAPTISCSDLSGSAGIQLSRTGVGGSYIPAHTTYAFNNQTIYYYNNTAYTNTNQFAVSVNANDATYNWSVTAGTANVSTTGVVTLGNNNTQNVTVRCRATINGVNKDATYTLNATATAALNETAYSDIEITPSAQTLDLGEEVTYTVSPSISQVTKTRPQYVSVTDAQGHTHYKVGTTYQAAEPTITETPGAAINFTSFSWSAAEGGAFFTLDPYYSASSNKVTLTRSAQKTGTQQTFTISVTGVYGGQNKTATATVTIPATQVDLTALHAGAAINLGVGSSESINGHYTYEPDYDAAGAPYLKFKYKSNNESVATVDASGKVTAVGPGSTTITVTAVKLDETDGVTCDVTVNVTIDAPTISIDGSGNVTITHSVPGVQIRYTTNGTDPTATTGTVYTASFKAGNEQTIKAIAVANGVASAVASQFYATSSVSDSKVILNDYEDHTWTYYAGVNPEVDGGNYNTNYAGRIYSPNPRNVKITYLGNGKLADLTTSVTGVKVGVDADANTFVYYKTIENNGGYKYTTIPNPFSVRPKINSNYYGFVSWRVKSVTGGTITGKAVGSTINAETEITFVPTSTYTLNCTSMEVELEAVWDVAEVSTDGTFKNGYNSVERNFYVVSSSSSNNLPVVGTRCTYSSFYPNGTTNGTTAATMANRGTRRGNFTCTADSKVEYIILSYADGTINADAYNLTIGRGCSPASGVSANLLTGMSGKTVASPKFHMRVESGIYNYVSFAGGYYTNNGGNGGTNSTISGTGTNIHVTMGSDYDRANKDNNQLTTTYSMTFGRGTTFSDRGNRDNLHVLDFVAKSGKMGTNTFMENTNTDAALQGGAGYGHYMSSGGVYTNHGCRNIFIEGGEFCTIGSGVDERNNAPSGSDTTNKTTHQNREGFHFRMAGGIIHGNVYGGAAKSPSGGNRVMIVTGGQVKGWFAAGCNGTDADGGQNYGTSWVYIGGNGKIDSEGSTKTLGYAGGGNVYAAGAGRSGTTTCGEMTFGSNLVIADNSYIERGAYGGGNYGYTLVSSNIYITGGTNAGNNDGVTGSKGGVYGGANQQNGPEIKMWMTGGKMYGGVYGGSNTKGTISGNVTMQINGGQVGQDAEHTENIHGGGYGQLTVVNGNVNITLGKTGAARDADGVTVWGDVYGGSALGQVNATATVGTTALSNIQYKNNTATNVTMNAGYIHGSLYGGALGSNTVAANVYGPVQVKVYGGSVFNTDGSGANGSGAVYGANNINGAPQRSVTVDIYGTNSAPAEGEYALFSVYGGGNQANYTYGNGYPKVTVHNCDNSIEYVYGGGNAAAVAATDVTIYGGDKIGNVFGGGNGQVRAANVTPGGTNVKIYGGTIGDVYGGSNTDGNIGGTINVNVNAQKEDGAEAACPIDIDNVYGGGNKAASAAGNVTIGCAEHIGAVYGGANQADINSGNIDLSIVSGHIDNVFGGNNTSGNISGTITVTVNDNNSACGMEVGNVYGGGNKAAYTAPATNDSKYPAVNIQNGHLTGSVFGGGLGETAVVTGNPQVTIGQPSTGTVHIDGNVFGGGDAANVVGKPVVLVQNCNTVIGTKDGEGNWNAVGGTVYGGGNAAHVTGSGNGTSVTINGGDINRVFGGGNGEESAANVEGDAVTTIHAGNIHQAFAGSNMQGNISGSATITVDHKNEGCEELIDEVYGGGNQAAGNAGAVNIDCGAIVGDVYGGANQADINSAITLNITGGTINRVFGGNNTSGNISGAITVNVNKKDACDLDLNYVYGAGNQASYTPSTPGAYPAVNILKGTVKQDVFGGGLGATAVVTSNPTVTVNGGVVSGNVFGGGSEANTVGTTSVTVQAGTVSTDVYGGGALADVEGNTTVAITGGTVTGNAYGGGLGRLEDAGAGITAVAAAVTGNTTVNVSGGTTNNVFGCNNFNGGPQGTVNVTISNGTVTNNVYGGGNLAAATANPVVTINGGTMQDVFGGGLGTTAIITGNPHVNVTGGTVLRDTYGGGALANVNGNTQVNLTGGTVGSVYGGGLGAVKGQNGAAADVEALVVGNTLVTLNGSKVTGSIFGCNNLNGTPQGHVKVHVLRTIGDSKPHVEAVYGGGNLAAYIPSQATIDANQGFAEVLIENCDNSINYVYGGGNAAPVPATQVTIYGADKIVNAFAGGNGAGDGNPGADIGYLGFKSSGNQTEYGTGVASIAVYGGTVDNVYGGSNTLGYIRNGSQVVVEDAPGDYTGNHCTLNVGNVFGGGNRADMDGNVNLVVGCSEGAEVIYAGASNADVNGNITLTITSGTYGKVFGGNNDGGSVNGSITVNIDETSTCWPVMIGELYGCGNNAAYTTPNDTPEPVVNVIACTKIGKVFGGGYGATATVTGNPTVNVNMIKGSFAGQSPTPNYIINNDGTRVANSVAYAIPDDYGQIGNIYGGGNAADVIGNTVVNISTIDTNRHVSGADQVTMQPVGANILGNVFGGGNVAKVSGDTTVKIGHE